ncbi:DNA gyrase subunit A [Orenia marismortui]|uniref:DNA topoisomerase (ATP-hydrolyzing) n=1 Tax=Orenia marismortui TaxID=46469 RepID=A0A4R8GY94_9FIRM|nr:DNA gyrase subunit A [Orenia marismortui]TDX51360.1 DNA gyrase subunit A [Orenia marismortui]
MKDKNIMPVAIEDKMRNSYLNYSLSVIIDRALPDVRDGLKPVHRRILYATKKLGLLPNKPHKKSARIVGEVLGKYHPHGDSAVYNAMVRMAQDFSQRYQLIDGHGNFGSIDGDSAAAMRYTEARLATISEELLQDIEEETVDFTDNFDGSLQEPTVLPSRVPNLLINGSSGIAVGMSTNIPPHNLVEVIDGLIKLLADNDITIEELMNTIPGPDFPTGGVIVGNDGIKSAYKTGKGKITLRGKSEIEDRGRGRERIVITEIPYQLSKSKLIEEIADTVKKGKIDNISDVRDESDRDGLRIVIDLKKKANPTIILNRLYKYTSLQSNMRINMLALVKQQPKVMNIKKILESFLDFRREVITRRTRYKLNTAKDKEHLLIGLKKATDQLDKVIQIIRSSKSPKDARKNLQRKLEVTKKQSEAILNIRLQKLVSLEIQKLEDDLKEIRATIKHLESILNSSEILNNIVRDELIEIKENYGDKRKTKILADDSKAEIEKEDLIKDKEVVISLSYRNYIKRADSLENVRSGKNDFITHISKGRSLDQILFFTNTGQSYSITAHELPEHHGLSNGDPLTQFLKLPMNEKIVAMIVLTEQVKDNYITIATKDGQVKKTKGEEYESTISSIKAINLNDGDEVVGVKVTTGNNQILLGTKEGYTIHFKEDEINDTGRNTKGSKGINLNNNDKVISFNIVKDDKIVVSLTKEGRGKASPIDDYTLQKRNGKGLQTMSNDKYKLLDILTAHENDKIALVSDSGEIFEKEVNDITSTKRLGSMYTQVKLTDDELIEIHRLPRLSSTTKDND